MTNYLNAFAASYPYTVTNLDTYGAGKNYGLSAQYMTFARQLGMTNQAAGLAAGIRGVLTNWFTYTPGETSFFFARYANWGGLIGFPASFGSEAFNDNHFHYGYFMLAYALLGTEDSTFLPQYGPMAKLIAKEYANWDRSDTNFPFLRVFDIWEGHSWAGGFSSGGGNNQESSSEAMNAWTGLFLLGNMLGDADMTAAGAMGYSMESAAVNEYWQDMYRTNFPASYGKASAGIVHSSGVQYGTFFSGDPAWIFGIQWVPANHWNNYLCRDKAFANWQLTNLWPERVTASTYGLNGFTLSDANNAVAQGEYLGNYILGFQALFDAGGVAAIMDYAFAANAPIATGPNFAGATYYLTHALRGLGDQDASWHTSLPTSQVYYNAATGKRTYVIYNPAPTNQTVTVFHNGVTVDSVVVPARRFYSTIGAPTNTLTVSLQTGAQIAWPTTSGNQYQLQWSNGPTNSPVWADFGSATTGAGASNFMFDAAYPALHSSYRVLEYTAGLGASVVANGGFESATGTNATGWNTVGSQPPLRVGGDARSGGYAMLLAVTNATSTPNTSEINQNLANAGGGPVVPGTVYTLSFWAKSATTGPSYVQNYGINWLNSGGGSVGFNGWIGFNPGGAWSQFVATNLVAPAGALNAVIAIYGATGAVHGGYGGTLIDDIVFSPPGSPFTNTIAPSMMPGIQLRWPGSSSFSYQVQKTIQLASLSTWTNLALLPGADAELQYFDAIDPIGQAYYRLIQSP